MTLGDAEVNRVMLRRVGQQQVTRYSHPKKDGTPLWPVRLFERIYPTCIGMFRMEPNHFEREITEELLRIPL